MCSLPNCVKINDYAVNAKYRMREFIDMIEPLMEKVIADYSNPFDPRTSYEIFKNGSRRELFKLFTQTHAENTSNDVRAILDPSGDLYFFDGHAAAHAGIKSFLGLHREGLHLNLYPDQVGVGWGRRDPTQAEYDNAVQVIRDSRRLQSIYGREFKIIAMRDIV